MKVLNMIIGTAVLFFVSMSALAGDIISSVASTSTQFVVRNSAEAVVNLTARKDLAAGSVPAGFDLATWNASVNAGTVAIRINRAINPANPSEPTLASWGQSSNSTDNTKKLNFNLVYVGSVITTQAIDTWRVAPQGTTRMTGTLATTGAQVLLSGRYPVGIEVASYAY